MIYQNFGSCNQFQFQSGAIQSPSDLVGTFILGVSIPKWCDSKSANVYFISRLIWSFNSKVVRFKAGGQ